MCQVCAHVVWIFLADGVDVNVADVVRLAKVKADVTLVDAGVFDDDIHGRINAALANVMNRESDGLEACRDNQAPPLIFLQSGTDTAIHCMRLGFLCRECIAHLESYNAPHAAFRSLGRLWLAQKPS